MEVETEESNNLPGQGSGPQSLKHSSCETEMQRILLLKANEGNFQEVLVILNEGVDINSADENGSTVLHYAVESDELEIVQELLKKKEIDVGFENNENITPLDIARENGKQKIIDVLVDKVIDTSLELLDDVLRMDGADESSTDTEERNQFKETEDRIEFCLKLLKKINEDAVSDTDNEDLSYREALIFIYFIETFALQNSANKTEKQELVNHFSQFYAKADITLFSEARAKLIKSALDKRLALSDIRKLINGSKVNFFKKLEEHVQYVADSQELKIFLEKLKNSYAEINLPIFRDLVEQEFEKFKVESGKQRRILRPEIFEYVVRRYPAFLTEKHGNLGTCQDENPNSRIKAKKKKRKTEKKKEDKDSENFFIQLQKFVYYVEHSNSEAKPQSSKSRFDECIKSFEQSTPKNKLILIVEQEKNGVEPPLDDIDIVKEELQNLLLTSYKRENVTEELLFNFIVNFYPAFQKETKVDLRNQFGRLRNNLIHRFYECGCVEFEKEIYPLKHLLLQYYCAREVKKELNSVQPDSNSKRINELLNYRFESFKEQFKSVIQTESLLSKDEADDFSGYKFLRLSILQKSDEVEILVNRYLDFMFIIDCGESEVDDSIGRNKIQHPQSREKLDPLGRRDIIEKFVKLRSMYETEDYDNEKKVFETELSEKFGVKSSNFYEICSAYEKNERSSILDSAKRKEISNIIKNLKRNRDFYELSNRVVISLYDRLLKKKTPFDPDENNDLLTNRSVRRARINEKFSLLPLDEIMYVSIGAEKLSISRRKLISNMFSTFYNSYYECKMELSLEQIFTEEIFLDYLVEGETEDCLEELVDPYLKLTFMIDSEKEKIYENKSCNELDGVGRREIYEGFYRLKRLSEEHFRNNIDRDFYETEQREFRDLALSYGVKAEHFKKVYELCTAKDYTKHTKEIIQTTGKNKIEQTIISLKKHFQSDNAREKKTNLPNRAIISLYQKVPVELAHVQDLLKYKSVEACKEIKRLINSLDEIGQKEVRVQFGDEKLSLTVRKVVCDMLETFEGKLKLKSRNDTIIKKLLKIAYTAPYVVRLITKVESDEIIEAEDLARLVEILLTEKDRVYIKHLNELLKIKSRKLNLYEELCDKILTPGFDIQSMHLTLEKARHAKGILTVLMRRIGWKNESFDTTVQTTRKILEIINNVIHEFIGRDEYENAFEPLNSVLKLLNVLKLTSKESRVWIDVAEYEARLKMAKVKIFQGKKLRDEADKDKDDAAAERKYEEALVILDQIPDDVYPQSLLALSRKAYTLFLKKESDKALGALDSLCKKILDLVRGSNDSIVSYRKEIYNEIRESQKYRDLLEISEEYKKYLDILKISELMSYKYRKNTSIADFEETLELCKADYSYKKSSLGSKHKKTRKALRYISLTHDKISEMMTGMEKYQVALKHSVDALVVGIRLSKVQKEALANYHPGINKTSKFIEKNLNHIVRISKKNKLHDASGSKDQWEAHDRIAHKISQKFQEYEDFKLIKGFIQFKIPKNNEEVSKKRKYSTVSMSDAAGSSKRRLD